MRYKIKNESIKRNVKVKVFILSLITYFLSLSSCEYGNLGNADMSGIVEPSDETFQTIMDNMTGVWYSHYGAIRTDGYRIGRWQDFENEAKMPQAKRDLFPDIQIPYRTCTAIPVEDPNDYYVFYDDTVYGQHDDGTGGNGGWEGLTTRYIGIVRAVNIFNGDTNRGAIIIEYLDNACPKWAAPVADGSLPFFGIFFRVINKDCIQMANAVDLAALYSGKPYYTETATLEEAIEKNDAANEAEFISWGVVLPQDRETP